MVFDRVRVTGQPFSQHVGRFILPKLVYIIGVSLSVFFIRLAFDLFSAFYCLVRTINETAEQLCFVQSANLLAAYFGGRRRQTAAYCDVP